jgi:hypothetical protein
MQTLDVVLAANRSAVDDLIAAAERATPNWTTPRAPGKWSPAQVAEHVARSRAMNPESTPTWPPTPAEAKTRLYAALATFERESRSRAGRTFHHSAFGDISVEDYARFTELHTRHHTKQIPTGSA